MHKNSFLKEVMKIAVPVALQSMLQSSFSMIDQVMVGQLGSKAVAAVEVALRPLFIFTFVTGAVAAVAGIMISQYLGKKDGDAVGRSVSVNLVACVLIAAVFSALCFAFPYNIASIYTEDAGVISLSREYIKIISGTYIPMGLSSIIAVYIRCAGKAEKPMYISFFAALINTLVNWILIFGNLGFSALGVKGAAVASLLSQLVNCILLFVVFLGQERQIGFSLSLGKTGYKQYFAILLPVVINEFLWSVGQNVNTWIYAHIGTEQLAAMALTDPIQGLLIGALSGLSQAAGILTGRRLGEEEYELAYIESKKLCLYGLIGSLILALLLVILRRPYVNIFNVETNVKVTASWLLVAFAVLSPIKVENMILGGGIIRSGGHTKYIMLIDLLGTWLVGVPLGIITAVVLHLPILWVYFILSQEELVRLLITIYLFRSMKWMETL